MVIAVAAVVFLVVFEIVGSIEGRIGTGDVIPVMFLLLLLLSLPPLRAR